MELSRSFNFPFTDSHLWLDLSILSKYLNQRVFSARYQKIVSGFAVLVYGRSIHLAA